MNELEWEIHQTDTYSRHILWQRLFTLLDEWAFYGLLIYFSPFSKIAMFWIILAVGAPLILCSYFRLWGQENRWLNENK